MGKRDGKRGGRKEELGELLRQARLYAIVLHVREAEIVMRRAADLVRPEGTLLQRRKVAGGRRASNTGGREEDGSEDEGRGTEEDHSGQGCLSGVTGELCPLPLSLVVNARSLSTVISVSGAP